MPVFGSRLSIAERLIALDVRAPVLINRTSRVWSGVMHLQKMKYHIRKPKPAFGRRGSSSQIFHLYYLTHWSHRRMSLQESWVSAHLQLLIHTKNQALFSSRDPPRWWRPSKSSGSVANNREPGQQAIGDLTKRGPISEWFSVFHDGIRGMRDDGWIWW